MKGQRFVTDFLSHQNWTFLYRIYFSFTSTLSTFVIINLFESEILINNSVIYYFFFIYLILQTFLSILIFSCIEVPFKKLNRLILGRYNITAGADGENNAK